MKRAIASGPDVKKLCKLWRGRAESLRKTVYANAAVMSRTAIDMQSLNVAETYDECAYELENVGAEPGDIEI